jgi:hypothetical protein
MKHRWTFLLPEGHAIIAKDCAALVLGQSSIKVSIPGRCEIRPDNLFYEINHLYQEAAEEAGLGSALKGHGFTAW